MNVKPQRNMVVFSSPSLFSSNQGAAVRGAGGAGIARAVPAAGPSSWVVGKGRNQAVTRAGEQRGPESALSLGSSGSYGADGTSFT